MLKLNRTTEYGLMAISYIREKSAGQLTSAREIADHFELPFEILAKTLQKLKDQGIIASTYGTRGGYILNRDLKSLNLAEFLALMEGPLAVVGCTERTSTTRTITPNDNADHAICEYFGQCKIHPAMSAFNDRLYDFLNRISVEEVTRSSTTATTPTAPFVLQGEEP